MLLLQGAGGHKSSRQHEAAHSRPDAVQSIPSFPPRPSLDASPGKPAYRSAAQAAHPNTQHLACNSASPGVSADVQAGPSASDAATGTLDEASAILGGLPLALAGSAPGSVAATHSFHVEDAETERTASDGPFVDSPDASSSPTRHRARTRS